ncbi:hypothetical protein ABHN09_16370 [Bacillus paramobilis]|uniref:hypothetical protein n=1 Tax=Bacillus paramobilis TaxID=2817477 RepID=UPI003D1F8CF2
MLWLAGLIVFFVGIVSMLFLFLFTYKIGEVNKAERHWYEINSIEKSVKKEMEQLKGLRDSNDD